jgi:ABC-2 type transport system permease protein
MKPHGHGQEPAESSRFPVGHSSFWSFWTLLRREILRFLSVGTQTLLAPMMSASLYLLIFGVSLGSRISISPHYSYLQFVIPGLIMMGVINNSFANSSSSLFMAKWLGYIADLLVTPLTPMQYVLAYTLASMIRSLVVGSIILGVSCFFTTLPHAHPLLALGMIALSSYLFAQFGILAALFSSSFDHLSMYTNFLILPLTYLGGMFYPVSELPGVWSKVSMINPIYYLIDGFRHALLGHGEMSLALSFSVAIGFSLVLSVWAGLLFKRGYRLRQ